jgi:hypothetical protein
MSSLVAACIEENRFISRLSSYSQPQLFASIFIQLDRGIEEMKSRSMMIALLGLGLMGSPVFAAGTDADQGNARVSQPRQAVPGTVNYIEGAVYLNGSQLNAKDAGNTTVQPGQEISTGNGKAEVLLTPGVFLRLDNNSTAKMISPDLALTQVELEKGRAGVEVDEIHDQNDLQVIDAGVTTRLNKQGYYAFDADHPEAMVFKGEAHVQVGDNKWKKIKGEHEFALNNGQLANEKAQKFDKDDAKDELYNWNSLRSQYMAEANNQMASEYTGPYAGPGWYWDPWRFGYAYMGMSPFASPFGWGFYPYGYGGGGYPYWGGGITYYRPLGRIHRGYVGGGHHGYVGGAVRGNPGHVGGVRNGGHFAPGGGSHGGSFGGMHGGSAGAFHGGGPRR